MNESIRKFGTFAGVYTPSVLTILGVIMYLRMGYVVGNAGMWSTIGIVLTAHVISITTGLGVSSIATDRKIEAGGIYYILSRSLGLPIGGAIGVTLFVGTALAISLYLVGFSESFIDVIGGSSGASNYGMSMLNLIRLVATCALILITLVAYISTNIALKVQFFILAAIALSLVSIFAGDWSNTAPVDPVLLSEKTESGWFNLFAIFFPAVTGFTAGVAMSGDLKDPKKSIPNGTILSIATGLIVYLSLAIFIAFSIPEDVLITDENVLKKYAWIPVLVVAGIWGATLSSAIGSLLGAPRILQAMSMDKIGPRVFAKGVGPENEPRNALILTFLLAEVGILIGELNTIAEIVSMFFLAAYGFINLAQFLESWASSDYLPSFKISKWFGLIGFIATGYVMVMLNVAAMVVALIVIGGIFVFLTRKQLTLGSGDVWQSVWSSVVKAGLKRMDQKEMHKRSWEPNILLFSGETDDRPHLIEFSKVLAGRLGMISNFDLVETPESKVLFPKHLQSIRDKEIAEQGIFARRQECRNIFQGVEMIASTYGFSGIDPNTVLMGWGRNTKDPKLFYEMTTRLSDLDYNVLYLDYDQKRGFGNYNKVDLWWSSLSKECEFMLSLIKLVQTSNAWRNAEFRILLINDENEQRLAVEEQIDELLNELRIQATTKVINNSVNKKSEYEIVRTHSFDADLVFLPIPELGKGKESDFVRSTDELVGIIGTALLVRASSHFDDLTIDLKKIEVFNQEKRSDNEFAPSQHIEITGSEITQVQNQVNLIVTQFSDINTNFAHKGFKGIQSVYSGKLTYLQDQIKGVTSGFKGSKSQLKKETGKLFKESIDGLAREQLITAARALSQSLENLIVEHKAVIDSLDSRILRRLELEDLAIVEEEDYKISRAKKAKRRLLKIGLKPRINIRFKELSVYRYDYGFIPELRNVISQYASSGYHIIDDLSSLYNEFNQAIEELPDRVTQDNIDPLLQKFDERLALFISDLEKHPKLMAESVNTLTAKYVNTLIQDADRVDVNLRLDERVENRSTRKLKSDLLAISRFPGKWLDFQNLMHNNLLLDYYLQRVKSGIKPIIERSIARMDLGIFMKVKFELNSYQEKLEGIQSANDLQQIGGLEFNASSSFSYDDIISSNINLIEKISTEIPDILEVVDIEGLDPNGRNFGSSKKSAIKLNELVGYLLESKLSEEIELTVSSIVSETQKVKQQLENGAKLITYTCQNPDVTNDQVNEVLQKSKKELESAIVKVDSLQEKLKSDIRENLTQVDELLDFKSLITRAGKLDRYIKRESSRRGWKNSTKQLSRLVQGIYTQIAQGYINKRDELSNAQFSIKHESDQNLHGIVKDFVDQITIKPQVEELLPFYYKQLFLGRYGLMTSDRENNNGKVQFDKAIQRNESGMDGAILITGNEGSCYLAEAEALVSGLEGGSFYKVECPDRTADLSNEIWENALFSSAEVQNWPEYKTKMNPGDRVYFKNIELWFLKGGENEAFDQLISFIRTYSGKLKICLSCNIEFYKFIKQLISFDGVLQSTIIIAPISLNTAIREVEHRHQSGGMKTVIAGKSFEQLGRRNTNRLFRKYHSISNGNLGAIQHLWLANISDVKKETIIMGSPTALNLPIISNSDWLVALNELLIHKVLTIETAQVIFRSETGIEIYQVFQSLKRCGLVIESSNTFVINPFAEMYVQQILIENGLIR